MLDTIGLPGAFELIQLSALGRVFDNRKARRKEMARQAMTPEQRREVDRRKAAGQKYYRECVLGSKSSGQQPAETDYVRARRTLTALGVASPVRPPSPTNDLEMARARLDQLGWSNR
jgi:hypothetical protein